MATSFEDAGERPPQSTHLESYYADQPKTALPKPEDLYETELGASHVVEFLRNYCTCGRPIAHHSFPIAQIASSPDPDTRNRAIIDYCARHNMQMCCRNIILHPNVMNVVSADIGACFIAPEAEQFIGQGTTDAPGAIAKSTNVAPPHILSHAKSGGKIIDFVRV